MRKHESNPRIHEITLLRYLTTALFIAVALMASVVRPEAASGTAEVSVTGTYNYEYAYEVLDQMNELRASVGVSSLVMDQTLLEYATQRAAEIAFLFEHTRPDGSSCFSIGSSVHGENIAYGYSTSTSVMNGWTNSSGHYANMVRSNFKSVGIGCFISPSGGIYWVQCFSYYSGTAASQPANGSKTVTVVI
ncbi:MAG: CAP domain-containing protein, partial [Lachnospiraceae bacterium]|nr:CAP domain-containing protein [Lachnospiraceae bacterium]